MKNKLIALYNTLTQIETKGQSTKLMADCLKYVEELIKEETEAEVC